MWGMTRTPGVGQWVAGQWPVTVVGQSRLWTEFSGFFYDWLTVLISADIGKTGTGPKGFGWTRRIGVGQWIGREWPAEVGGRSKLWTEFSGFTYDWLTVPASPAVGVVGTGIRWFSNRKDGSLSIGYVNGILKYPNREMEPLYEDAITFDGRSTGRGIETKLDLVIGEIHDLIVQAALFDMGILHEGESVDGVGKFDLKFYADGAATPFDSKRIPMDKRAGLINLTRFGLIERLRAELSLPTSELLNFRAWKISELVFNLVRRKRIGKN